MKKRADGKKSQTTDKSATPLWQSALSENHTVQGLKSPPWLHLAGSSYYTNPPAECLWVFSNPYETGYCFQAFLVAHCSHHGFTPLTIIVSVAERVICGGMKIDQLL